ncbi:MAG TPA: acyl-CoA thioesterase [Acidimicrobiales bacterium]|nr:acyl-CoA thioesterase [Acidimicrobiales bacterium]
MDIQQFLGLEETGDPTHWRLPVTEGVCTPLGFLYGGAGLAAGVAAMEAVTARPVLWATAQFLSSAYPPAVLELDVTPSEGAQIAQARVVATADGAEVLLVAGAFGERPMEAGGQWVSPPAPPPPETCPTRRHWHGEPTGVAARLDIRIADGRRPDELDGTPGTGTTRLWVRAPGLDVVDGAALALLADYVPFGVGQALGQRAGGTSLDTTLRVVRAPRRSPEWLLLDVHVAAVERGVAHGHLDMWTEDGTLLATAAQSAVVRFWRG